jgi:hypothetical protein
MPLDSRRCAFSLSLARGETGGAHSLAHPLSPSLRPPLSLSQRQPSTHRRVDAGGRAIDRRRERERERGREAGREEERESGRGDRAPGSPSSSVRGTSTHGETGVEDADVAGKDIGLDLTPVQREREREREEREADSSTQDGPPPLPPSRETSCSARPCPPSSRPPSVGDV